MASDGIEYKNHSKVEENAAVQYPLESNKPLSAQGIVSTAIKNGSRDDITAIVINGDQVDSQGYTVAVFDGHAGKQTAELCQYFYNSIQTAWVFYYHLLEDYPQLEENLFAQYLSSALEKAWKHLPQNLSKTSILPFKTLFEYLSVEFAKNENQEENLLIAYNETVKDPIWEDLCTELKTHQHTDSKTVDYDLVNHFFESDHYKITIKQNLLDALDTEIDRLELETKGEDKPIKLSQLETTRDEIIQCLKNEIIQQAVSKTSSKQTDQNQDEKSSIIENGTAKISLSSQSRHSKTAVLAELNNSLTEALNEKMNTLAAAESIGGYRNKIGGFLKSLAGILLSAPLIFTPILFSSSYRNYFFKPVSQNNVNDIKNNFKAATTTVLTPSPK